MAVDRSSELEPRADPKRKVSSTMFRRKLPAIALVLLVLCAFAGSPFAAEAPVLKRVLDNDIVITFPQRDVRLGGKLRLER